jgi:hypothetical protein
MMELLMWAYILGFAWYLSRMMFDPEFVREGREILDEVAMPVWAASLVLAIAVLVTAAAWPVSAFNEL